MTFGVELLNDTNGVVVDSTYRNYLRVFENAASLTFTAVADHEYFEPITYTFPTAITHSVPPVTVLKVTSGRLSVASFTGGPGNWTGIKLVTDYTSVSSKTVGVRIAVYAPADSGQISLPGNYGMQVFTGAGVKTFDSRATPLLVDQVHAFTIPTSYSAGQQYLNIGSTRGLDAAALGWLGGSVTTTTSGQYTHNHVKLFLESSGAVVTRKFMRYFEDGFVYGAPPLYGTTTYLTIRAASVQRR